MYLARQNMSSTGAIRHPPQIYFPGHNPYRFVPKQKGARTSKTRTHASPRYKPKAAMETPNFPLNSTFPATTTSQPNTSNQTPTTHHPEQKTTPPSHPPTPLLSPFQSHPRTLPPTVLPTPHNNNNNNNNNNSQQQNPIQTLHTFNLLHSIPAMPPTHPTVLELRQHHPVLPHHLQLEHDLRTLAIEGWFARHSHTDGFEHAWDLNITNNLQAQEEVKEASLHTERRSQWYQSTNAGTGIGNAHVENSKVVKPDLGSSHLPHLHLGQGQHVVDGVANYGVWGGGGGADILLQGTSNNNDHNNNDNAGDGGDESHSYGLKQGVRHDLMLNDVPATMAGWEAEAGGEDFDPGPWEEIGRQWARIRPWELH